MRRKANGQTLADVASELGVSQPFLSKLERGEVATSSVLEDLVEELGLADCRMQVRISQSGRLTATLTEVHLVARAD